MLESALVGLLVSTQLVAQQSRIYRTERDDVGGGAEIVTIFSRSGSAADAMRREIPLLSVLRDTLGSSDPDSSRLRYVWVLTSTKPTLLQRATSALSFAWFRAAGKRHADQVPAPVLDLASTSKSVWSHMAVNGVQALQLDTRGVPLRSSTRSYRGNFSEYRQLQIFSALEALDAVSRHPSGQDAWSANELRAVYSRLDLSTRMLGGLVRDQNLPKFYDKETSRRAAIRGHNWELLRQTAESSGLYFEPLALAGQTPTEALLWIARSDLEQPQDKSFDRQFLGIGNPWNDQRLMRWTGYTESWYFDSAGRRVSPETSGARRLDLIPLALYSLDYPKVPLLLVDFRSSLTAKKRELAGHAASTVFTGVLDITRFGNWPFLAASSAFTFVRGRHGAPTDRAERLRSYSEAREFLAVDAGLTPELRSELLRRLDHLALDPLENAGETETRVAKEQFAALMQYAQSPYGLAARLHRDRRKELEADTHSRPTRLLASAGRLLRIRPAPSSTDPAALRAELAARRQTAARVDYLRALLASSPRPEIVDDPGRIRQAIETISNRPFPVPRAPRLIAQIFERTESIEVRMACLAGLQRLDVQEARAELARLARDPAQSDFWRAAASNSFGRDPEPAASSGSSQF